MADFKQTRGASAEVTPEMLKAGVTALAAYNYDSSNEEEVVAAIFQAMTKSRLGRPYRDSKRRAVTR